MTNAIRHGARYLEKAFAPGLIEDARARLAGIDFDTMVGTGISGALVVGVLGRALGKNFAVVRKENDTVMSNHSGHAIEGLLGKRWVFVDDLIASGATRARVLRVVKETDDETKFVGTYTYGDGGYTAAQFRTHLSETETVPLPPKSERATYRKVSVRRPYQYEEGASISPTLWDWDDWDAPVMMPRIEKFITDSVRELPSIPTIKSLIPLEV